MTALDADAVPALDAARAGAAERDAASDIFGASNVGKPVLVNGGVLVLVEHGLGARARPGVVAQPLRPGGPVRAVKLLAELWRRDHPKFRLADGVFRGSSRAVRNRHHHAIEQASRRWRGGRDDSARTRRKI